MDPGFVVIGQRPVRPNEGVLRRLLGIARIAEHTQRDRVEPILVGEHEPLEGAVEVAREIGQERCLRGSVVDGHQSPERRFRAEPLHHRTVAVAVASGLRTACDNPAVAQDDRFDDLIESLAGFHRSWLIYLGLELGLFAALREAGERGLASSELATVTATHQPAIDVWAWAADAHRLTVLEDGRLTVEPAIATVLLDDDRADFLGGQFVHAVVASMDWGGMLDFFRTGVPTGSRPDRYRVAIERLTRQDIAVFFQEALAALPQLVVALAAGGRVVDVHCGGGRWLVAMARRFPNLDLVGVEFEADSVARARATVASAGLEDRIDIRQARATEPGDPGEFDLAYFQYALHQLADAPQVLRAAWAALRPGGSLVVLDWPLPSGPDEFRSRHGELIAGVHLDEVYQGTALATRDQFGAWFADAGLPAPTGIDLPSGAALFVLERPA